MSRRAFAQTGSLITGSPTSEVRLSTQPAQDEAGVWTVQFAVSKPDFGSTPITGWIRPFASVSWMVAGNAIVREIDIGEGTTISGTCEAVTVRVIDRSSSAVPSGVAYSVTITATPGLRPIGPNPPFLLSGQSGLAGVIDLPGNSQKTIQRPSGAGTTCFRVLLGGNAGSTHPPNVNISGGPAAPGTEAFSLDMVGATSNDSGWVPWPPEAGYTMVLTNLDNNDIHATVFWGVDG